MKLGKIFLSLILLLTLSSVSFAAQRIQLRRDTVVNWASVNPILAQGEPGVELDTNKLKLGNGVDHWNDLPYFENGGGGGNPGGSSGQFQYNNAGVFAGGAMLATNGANVGIGVSNPSEKLEVVGNIKSSGTVVSSNIATGATVSGMNTGDQVISDATITTSDITNNNASTSKHGFLSKLDGNANHFMDGQGNWSIPAGNDSGWVSNGVNKTTTSYSVGIGNSAPTTELDVTGTINASTDVLVNGTSVCLSDGTNCSGSPGSGTINAGTTNYFSKYTGSTTLSQSTLLYDNGTNVSVGTTSVSATLGVKGTSSTNASKSFEITNSNNQSLFSISNAGNIGIGTSGVMSNSNGQVAKWDNILFNTSFGVQALDSTTTGNLNAAFGNSALSSLTTGVKSNAFGDRALNLSTTGTNNAFGSQSQRNTSTGTNNTSFGHGTLYSNTTGNGNTALGHQAGHHSKAGTENIYIGHDVQLDDGLNAGPGNLTESMAMGYQAFVTQNNSFVFGGRTTAREIKVGINVPNPSYKISLSGMNDNTIGNEQTLASATAGKSLTILAGKPSVAGVITNISTTPTSGGSGYSPDDELTITTGDGTATVWVNTTDGSGACTKVYLMKRGSGYSTGVGQVTSGGGGTGCTINITGVTADPTNLDGGDLILSGGSSTGTETSNILLKTATAGSSGSSANVPTTKMVIDGDGNVSIGTSATPTAKLDISGSGSKIKMRDSNGVVWSCGPAITTGAFTCS